MKPYVIYVEDSKNDKITLTKDEFEKLLEETYQSGYNDGQSNRITIAPSVPYTPNSPSIQPYPDYPYPNHIWCGVTTDKSQGKTLCGSSNIKS